jgi:hypothetical protein
VKASVTGLTAGTHTLRIVPISGTIAIDAFAVEAVTDIPGTATPAFTEEPMILPTGTGTSFATPTAQLTGTATPTPLPVMLPVLETFDRSLGWTGSGSWRFDIAGARSGAGWFGDSTARNQISTLTYGTPIDLSAAVNPQLSFWQKPSLSVADFFAVDLSLDGGLTWLALDTQMGLVSDWTPRTLDLSPYRGQIVLLRFRLDTLAVLPGGIPTVGVWVDDLLIQEAPPQPTPTATPTGIPSMTPWPTELPLPTPTQVLVPTVVPTELPPVVTATEVVTP